MFEIRINNRKVYSDVLLSIARKFDRELTEVQITEIIRLSDKITKISPDEFISKLKNIVGEKIQVAISQFVHSPELKSIQMESEARENLFMIVDGLTSLGIKVKLDPTLARGFDYYTGTIFEIFDVSGENNRSMHGGGRYDNLTEMFGGEAISGIGFGMGDVTMRDFLETHGLLTANITAPTVMVIPTGPALNLAAQKIAQDIRRSEVNVATDISTKKLGKKIGDASERLVEYIIVVGEDELASGIFTLRSLLQESETKGSIIDLINQISN